MLCSSEVYLFISNFNVQIFVIVFVNLRHVTRVSLQIALWHMLHMMFCQSFSVIWLTIVFCSYFVLWKVRYLPVGTVLQWIHFCCGLWEVNFMHNATLFIGMISCSKSLWHFLHMYSADVGIENLFDRASTTTVLSQLYFDSLNMIHCDLGISVLWQHVHIQ